MNPLMLKVIAGLVVAAMGVASGALGARIYYLGVLNKERLVWQEKRTELAEGKAKAEGEARTLENKWNSARFDATEGLATERAINAKITADLAGAIRTADAQSKRVRELAEFARGAGQAGSYSTAAAEARAAALAATASRCEGLLDRGRRLLIVVAGERDDLAAEVTACVQAWPTSSAPQDPR